MLRRGQGRAREGETDLELDVAQTMSEFSDLEQRLKEPSFKKKVVGI